MTEPTRLLEDAAGECDAFEANLLCAGRGDAMSPSAKRALVTAALGGTLAVTAGVTAGAPAAAGATVAKLGASALTKWIVLGLLGVVVAGGAALALPRTPATTATPVPAVSMAHAAAAQPARSAQAPSEPIAPTTLAPAAVTSTSSAPARRPAPSSSAAPLAKDEGDLAAEVALIEQARDAVVRHDGPAALALLAEHARSFPRPALGDEASVLRVEAVAAEGETARTNAVATQWLAAHPTSPYVPRVRRLLAQSTAAGSATGAL